MATRTFLTPEQATAALATLKKDGAVAASGYIGSCLENKLAAHPNWQASRPVRLGSWARGELCAKSDIDLLFFGSEETVSDLVRDFQKEGIKIRARVPEDLHDWTVGVEAFDVLALLSASVFFEADKADLQRQVDAIWARDLKYFKKLYQTMREERQARTKRYDSITSFLEPNLKYGAGALRDLEQGMTLLDLFFDQFEDLSAIAAEDLPAIARLALQKNKELLLGVRHFLHLSGAGDTLVGPLQPDMAKFFGFESAQKMMSQIERALSETSFYSDWVTEVVKTPKSQFKKLYAEPLEDLEKALRELAKNPSLHLQAALHHKTWSQGERKKLGRLLQKYFHIDMSEETLMAFYRANIFSQVIPHFARLTGHVQHDQYHRFSADAHAIQAVREVLRLKKRPKVLGQLAVFARDLSSSEWEVLLWSAFYHDLGKGLKGDHSTEGAQIVKKDFVSMGLSLKLTAQVAWMVQNHLLLSGAAFRQNPQSAQTWAELFRRGVKGRRIPKLALLTAIDIRATNPEAWNEWKEKLLFELASALQSPKASRLNELIERAEKKKIRIERRFVELLDPRVVESVPSGILLDDLRVLQGKARGGARPSVVADLAPLVVKTRSRETWVRFHAAKDRPGLFFQFVQALFSNGVQIQESYVQTDAEKGAYDWFRVKTSLSPAVLKKALSRSLVAGAQAASGAVTSDPVALAVRFAVIEVTSSDEKSAIISFRGRDQKGALLAAAQALYQAGFEILSAQVHTWGRQIEDVFTVRNPGESELRERVKGLQASLLIDVPLKT